VLADQHCLFTTLCSCINPACAYKLKNVQSRDVTEPAKITDVDFVCKILWICVQNPSDADVDLAGD